MGASVISRIEEIATPALVLDLDAFEANVSYMAGFLRARRKAFRPHGKTHKCPEVARRLVEAGAVGTCAAKLGEAEVFAHHGLRGLLITTPVIGADKVRRAVRLATLAPDTIFCVDTAASVAAMSEAAAEAGGGVVMHLAVDLFFGRTGVAPGPPAADLARFISRRPHVAFAGLQAYDGGAAHTTPFDARQERSRAAMTRAVETRREVERAGIACPLVTGGSTGTYRIDAEIDGVTELQPGSFVFMDMEYGRIGGPGGTEYRDFRQALTVVTTVISRPPGYAIVDAGYKAFATDRPFTPQPIDLPGATYHWAGDEHGRLDLKDAERNVVVGDRIQFVPPHCDPTVNLYDEIHAVRHGRVEGVWPIAARGKSQ
jgi:D-serine deaminase-like pyridoxal phosphate-dependent protein